MKRNAKFILFGFIFLFVLAISTNYIHNSMNYKKSLLPNPAKEEDSYKSDIGAEKNIINILFLGIDKTDERESWLGIYRSDTIAIARFDLDNKRIKILSIPRDT